MSMPQIPGYPQQGQPETNQPVIMQPVMQPDLNVNLVPPQMQPQMQVMQPQVPQVPQIEQTPFDMPPVMQAPIEQFQQVQVPAINETVQQNIVAQQIAETMVTPIQQELNVTPQVTETIQQEVNQVTAPLNTTIISVLPEQSVATIQPEVNQVNQVQEPVNIVTGNGLDFSGLSPEDSIALNQVEVSKPIVAEGLQSIGHCSPAAWGGFIKTLEFLSKDLSKDDIISVENGLLDTNKDGVFIHCDLQNILGQISLSLINPQFSTKLLKIIRGGELVQIFADNTNQEYNFCSVLNGKIATKIKTKFTVTESNALVKGPTLTAQPYVKEISNSEKEVLRTIIAGKAAMENDKAYRFGFSKIDNTLVSIGVDQDFTYYFQDSSIPTVVYKVWYPFPVPNLDSCIIKFYNEFNQNTQQQEFWLQTISNIEMASIVCTEKIEEFNAAIEDMTF